MTALLVGVAVYTILGGMLSVLVTDFLQFIVMSAGLIVVTMLILMNVGWESLVTTVETHYGAGGFNPFINPTMGWEYVVFNLLLNTAAVLTWQTTIARVLAAKDTETGRKVYTRTSFFFVCRFLIPGIWGIAALATLGPVAEHARSDAALSEHGSAAGPDGPADRGHAGGRHVHRLFVHADVGQRDLQRHHGPFPQDALVREEGSALEPLDHRLHRRVSAALWPVVSAQGRSLDVPGRDRHDLSGEHFGAADRLLLLA